MGDGFAPRGSPIRKGMDAANEREMSCGNPWPAESPEGQLFRRAQMMKRMNRDLSEKQIRDQIEYADTQE